MMPRWRRRTWPTKMAPAMPPMAALVVIAARSQGPLLYTAKTSLGSATDMPPVYATKPKVAAISDQRSQVELRMVRKPSRISRNIPRGPLADVVAGEGPEPGNERTPPQQHTNTTKTTPHQAQPPLPNPLAHPP